MRSSTFGGTQVASSVPFDNSTSTILSEDVQGALDETDALLKNHDQRHLPNGTDPLATAVPLATFTANQLGTANAFARSDHRHNTELLNYNVRQIGEVQTNSTNDVQLQDMLITPAEGQYVYIAGASFKHFNATRTVFFSVYKNNSQEPNTLSQFTTGANNQARETQQMWTISGQISMNGTDSIGIRWRSSSGTARAFLRFITLIRVG